MRPFAGYSLLSGFSPPCALWLRERMYFFVTAPTRLDLGLPRRTALQGFARICVHSRAKICFPVFPLRVLCGSVRCIFSQRRLRAWIWGCHGGQPSKDSRGFASIRGPKSAFRFPPPCALRLREMYFFRNGACTPGSAAATEDSPPRVRGDSRPFAG